MYLSYDGEGIFIYMVETNILHINLHLVRCFLMFLTQHECLTYFLNIFAM